MSERQSQSPDLSVADKLDNEIANLRAQVESLKRDLQLQTATLLTSEPTRKLLQPASHDKAATASLKTRLRSRADAQDARRQQGLYRTCAGMTAFRVRDPDPNATDGGAVLGLRIEAMAASPAARGFLRPFYVLLNRPYPGGSRHLRVHRHTVPASVPLAGLAARHLPAPSARDSETGKQQDLAAFARALRRELVRYQNRCAVIGDVRRAAGLEGKNSNATGQEERGQQETGGGGILDVSAADPQATQIRIDWLDGRTGRLVMTDDGVITQMVVQGESGRDRETARKLLGGGARVEDIVRHLTAASTAT
ncbi:Cenp-O kinetochore centromere component-domain-containing protein [Xylariomycetidae sp. FL0641]|nr:Cenp-O kinetochore centromere component-domain-containing protein [Xylariomycetidae sp. FL0641]